MNPVNYIVKVSSGFRLKLVLKYLTVCQRKNTLNFSLLKIKFKYAVKITKCILKYQNYHLYQFRN